MILTEQEWRLKEKTSMSTLIDSNDNMDLLDDDESPLIKEVFTADRYGFQHGFHAATRVQGRQ
jgi:hypothetical protein